jgi:hypothetical protein
MLVKRTLFCVGLFLITTLVVAQEANYFIVVGAFDNEQNAKRFLLQAEALNLPARYAVHPEQKRFYVYVRLVTERSLAMETLKSVRSAGFERAWIFTGDLLAVGTLAKIQPAAAGDQLYSTAHVPEVKKPIVTEVKTERVEEPVITTTASNNPEIKNDVAPSLAVETESVKPAGKPFLFKLLASNGQPLVGVVRLQETDRANQFRPYNSNEMVYVTPPTNRAGKWFVVCDVVGYRTYRVQFNYNNAAKVMDAGENGEFVLPIEMVPVKRGDYVELDRVRFFPNSQIFTPESKAELDELVAMMTNNLNYKIRIHGHTNGDKARDIVALGDSPDLFGTSVSNAKYAGSAKELSTLRAESVKRYLLENDIEESRISTKGEGGKQMVFEGTMAALNDRVEIEVLKH